MFSVEDLLISHGYQPPKKSSKDKPPSSDENTYTSCPCEVREDKSDHGTVNGYETDSGACSTSRQTRVEGYFSDSEGSARRQAGVSYCADVQNLPTFAGKEAGLNSGPPLLCSSRPKSGKDVTYWRRRGQDFSVLLDYTNRGDSDYKGNNVTKTQNIPKAEQRGKSSQDAQLKKTQHKTEVSRINEQKGWMAEGQSVTVREMCEDKWRTPVDRKCQSLGTEEWKSSLGRQLSDGDGNKLRHGVFPHKVGDEVFKSEGMQHIKKGKSQSLPRDIPESNGKEFQTGLHYVDMSGFDRNRLENQCLQDHLVLQDSSSYCNPKTSSKWTENFRQSAQFAQLPKAKFSRPLKPPSYELYQQIRRSSEMIPSLHVHGENDGQESYFAKDSEASAGHNFCPQALASSSLEPPVYVPPPSYKAPPQLKASQKCFDKVPTCNNTCQPYPATETLIDQAHWCLENQESNHAHQKQMPDDNGLKHHLLQAKNENDHVGKDVPHKRESCSSSHNGYTDDQKAFVKYIPFNDPRIRHITLVQSEKQYGEADNKYEQWNAQDHVTDGNKTFGPSDRRSAFSVPSGPSYSTQAGVRPIVDPTTSNRWLVASKPEGENGTKSDHCCKPYVENQCDSSLKYSSRVLSTTNHPAGFPHSNANSKAEQHVNQGTFETITQVKKWEPDSQCFEVQEKKRPKRRMTETIFCLVSVPVKTFEGGSNEDVLNNDMRTGNVERVMNDSTGNLTEQSFLSMSSSDLELQALTGNMMSENGLKRPQPWNEVNNRHAVGYNFNQHRELRASGSWPGDQYRDQETQTSFIKGPRTTRSFSGAIKKVATGNQIQSQNYSEPESIVLMKGDKRSADITAISVQKRKLSNCSINGQTSLYPSTNSAFSRTASTQYQVSHINSHQSQLNGASKSPREKGRDVSAEVRVEESRVCPQISSNNGKETVGFGQFLLKPVNRRPWDAISELESFNKEIQEQEDRNIQALHKENEDGELTAIQSINSDKDFSNSQMMSCQKPELCVPEKSFAKMTKAKEKLDSGSNKSCPDYTNIIPEVQNLSKISTGNNKQSSQSSNLVHKPSNKRTTDTKSSTIINVFTTKNAQFTKLNNEKNVEDTKSKRKCININGVRKPMYHLSETKTESTNNEETLVRTMALGKKTVPTLETECDGSIGKMLSQLDKDQGYSETDLSSLRCHKSTKPNVDNLNDLFEQQMAEGISKNESLEERAARILGIDVAVEALISPGTKMLHQDTGENETNSSAEEELGITCDHFIANRKNSSEELPGHVKEKPLAVNKQSEWKHSPLYGIGTWIPNGSNVLQNKLSKHPTESNKELQLGKRAIINEIFHGPFKEFYNWADNNCCFSTERKNASVPGIERKGRNTSEMIEALQGKLASSPSRTALERLARMKEVDSVSRIRRLSIKSADSGDELDEENCSTERGEKEGVYTSARREDTCITRKRVISLDQDLESLVSSITADAENKETGDVYDPSKVETV
ncbi:junctional cadherin 5-associated protein isoform X2 [Heptranchias perlo]|uniref:junctional cadherin 5-associated protein isoform X2 n=1 Tax=Heptranchias perlo TaxID=212740 RepID=UPI00355A3D58